MEKQKFEIRIALGSDDEKVGVKVEIWKDGKISDFSLLEGENLRLACESLRHALGIFASRYLYEMNKQGVISDEEYSAILNKNN